MTWFTYTEIKFIPDIVKEETVNVGVLVSDDNGNIRSKFIDNFDYITKIHGIDDVKLLEMVLPSYGVNKRNNPKYLEVLSEESIGNHRIRIPPPRAIDSESMDAALDEIYSDMISIPDKTHTQHA